MSERSTALSVLEQIINKKSYNSIALSSALASDRNLDKRQRAFITEITNGTLRNIMLLDYIIDKFSKTPIKRIKPIVLNILRLSVYELMFMSTPDYAICSEAVQLTKARGYRGLSGFVNGVLRNIARNKNNIVFPNESLTPSEYLSVVFSHPKWIVDKWLKHYEYDFVKNMLKKNNEPPSVSVCVNTLKTSVDELIDKLTAGGAQASKSPYAENALILKNIGSIKELDSYRNGFFHVQDIASQIAVKLLSPRKGDRIVDLCAAPGGKSFFCSYLMENEGIIHARDVYDHKMKLIEDGAKRLGIKIIKAENHDAAVLDERLLKKADKVIADVPCSGLGIIRKKPDIKLNRTEKDITALQKLQRNIMATGAEYVKDGGFLLYSTCTLTREENLNNVNWFLDNYDFELTDIVSNLPDKLTESVENSCLTLFPHIHETDGFFVAKLRKKGEAD